jgi:DNA-binding response OmpR family regulator
MATLTPPARTDRRVLIIDDSAFIRLLVRKQLLEHAPEEGLAVLEAADGITGVEVAREGRPDLILLDICMPGTDGFETLRRLKADPRTRAIPVIFLSSASAATEVARGLDLGGADYVTKPFDPIELRARIRAVLRHKDRHDLLRRLAFHPGPTGPAGGPPLGGALPN